MEAADYRPNTAKNPKNLTESKGWEELLEKHLPDVKITEAHREALEATKIHTSHTEPDIVVPDHQTRLRAVDLAYKIKDKYPKEGLSGGVHFHQHIEEQKEKYSWSTKDLSRKT